MSLFLRCLRTSPNYHWPCAPFLLHGASDVRHAELKPAREDSSKNVDKEAFSLITSTDVHTFVFKVEIEVEMADHNATVAKPILSVKDSHHRPYYTSFRVATAINCYILRTRNPTGIRPREHILHLAHA